MTEALPVAFINGREYGTLIKENKGIPLGKSIDKGIKMKIVKFLDKNNFSTLNEGEVGELILAGDIVSESYYDITNNRKNKVLYKNKKWLRTGDLVLF